MSRGKILSLEDLRLCNSAERMLTIFQKLGYNVEYELDTLSKDLFFDTTLTLAQKVEKIFMLADYEEQLQIFLFEVADLSTGVLHAIARKVLQRAGYYLFVFTINYSKFVFVNPRRTMEEKARVKINKLIVNRAHPTRHDIEILNAIQVNGKTPEEVYSNQCEAFDINKVTNRFYQEYKKFFEKVQKVIKQHNPDIQLFEDKTELHQFAQRFMGRIMFLYFIQKKGWLAGDYNFLRNHYDIIIRTKHGNYYKDFLEKLFFEVLCVERERDESEWGNIPFLNGGLFERDYTFDFTLPNPFFDPKSDDGLLGFLNNYNFTIEEDTPLDIEVALDPEMLGKIFENLLEEDERKKSGTYYTPRPVVHFICQTTLIEQLYERTDISKDLLKDLFNETTLEAFFDKKEKLTPKKARKIDDELSEIKILDPAVGSGAFLIAMLQNLMFARRRCKKVLGESVTRGTTVFSQWKLEFIKRCLYGVDIKPEAIEIAKLRFWLSLVVDMEREHVQPLPNLDYNLMVGDSLIEELSGEGFFTESELSARTLTNDEDELLTRYQILFKKLREIKNDYFDAPINDHPKLRENILELEKEILSLNYHNQQKLLNNELKKKTELLEKKRVYLKEQSQIQKTLIPPKQKGTQKKLITFSKIKKEISNIEKSIKILNKKLKYNEEQLDNFENGEYRPFFSYKLHFGDVFQSNGGFDIVIGNPPYGVKVKNNLQKNFGLQSKDTYGVFIIRGLQLLRSGGYLSFITSDTWQTIKSHLLLREFILNNTMVYHLLSMPGWVFGATVNTSILTLKYIPNREKRVEREENIIYLTDFTNIPSQNIDALELILTNLYSNKLKEIAKSIDISIGIYHYKQKLIKKFSNLPFFIASPKIFQITNDVDSPIEKIKRNEETYELRKIKIDNEFIRVFTFGNIAIIKKGIDTGENKIFLFQIEGVYGNYRIIDFHEVLSKDEIKSLSDEDKFYGIDPRSHNGKYILPYDKGGESKTENGWLPNYYVPTDYFIDWSKTSVNLLKERKKASKHKSTIRNKQFWFKEGITFSLTGQYCPTLRFGSGALFDNNGSTIFCKFFHPNLILAVFCSKLGKYIFKNYINHTVHAQVDDFKIFPFIEIPKVEQEKLIKLVNSIKQKQMKNKYYNYFQYEQKEIEEIIDKIYKLNQDDIKEVDSWYERKYPILVDAQKQIEEESK